MINEMRYMLGRSLCVIAILMIHGNIESNAKILLVNIPMHIILNKGDKVDSSSKNNGKNTGSTSQNNKTLEGKISILNTEITKLKKDTTKLNSEIARLKEDTTKLNSEIARLKEDTTKLNSENNGLRQELNTLQTQKKDLENKASDDENAYIPLYSFFFAISLLSVYLYSRNRKLENDIDKKDADVERIREDLKEKEEELRQKKGMIDNKDRLLEEKRNEITNLKKRLEESNLKTINTEDKYQANRQIISTKEIKEIPKVVEKFFMSNPNKLGTFSSESKIVNYDPTSCYYEFEKTGDNLYEFFLIDEIVPRALKYRDRVIDPVCDSIDGSSRNCEKIITVTKGKAELDGNIFRVIEKAQIKYV